MVILSSGSADVDPSGASGEVISGKNGESDLVVRVKMRWEYSEEVRSKRVRVIMGE